MLSKPCSRTRHSMLFSTVIRALSELVCPTRCGHVPKALNSRLSRFAAKYTQQKTATGTK
jgi:hypothetical protein